MIVTGEVIFISTFKKNIFTIRTKEGDIQCKVADLNQWDEIYNYFNRPIKVEIVRIEGDIATSNNVIWIKII